MSKTLAAILGGAAGAVAFVGVLVIIIWFCFFHARSVSRTSETGSSDPSVQCESLLRAGQAKGKLPHNFIFYLGNSSHDMQLEELLELNWLCEMQDGLTLKSCLWPQKTLVIKV